MPLLETKGAASAQGFGLTLQQAAANYIEDVFSTWLYTGNDSTQTIVNGIDLAGKGGMVWLKGRGAVARDNYIFDTNRGVENQIRTNLSNGQANQAFTLTAFNSNGFSLGSNTVTNSSAQTGYVSWTFRKQAKFFDVVTYTGTGANRTVAHNLGSVPGCIITKRTDTTGNWITYHRSLGNTDFVNLNGTAATSADSGAWNNTTPTSTEFSLGTGNTNVNGGTYVAYLFAHNAGGFGLTGTDNVISCGSYTLDGSNPTTVNLGYEPQFLIWKASSTTGNWFTADNMRGLTTSNCSLLFPNLSNGESTGSTLQSINATGFTAGSTTAGTYIYIAIRRGPMRTPTSGTSVFAPITYTGNATTGTARTTGFVTDAVWSQSRQGNANPADYDRLRGSTQYLSQNQTSAETTQTGAAIGVSGFDTMNGYLAGEDQGAGSINFGTWTYVNWAFRRAPGFFDEVCYTGTGAAALRNHNLGVAPELMIIKGRNFGGQPWAVYAGNPNEYLRLNTTNQSTAASDTWNYTTPTSTQFGTGTSTLVGASGWTYVAYLFASCPGVSKVGSYTGTGALQTINCGFTGGARFVLIKRTDSTGDWFTYDSARGISSGNDPYLLLNSTAAEVTGTNYVDTTSVGFQVTAAAPAGLNASGGTYIFLAIA